MGDNITGLLLWKPFKQLRKSNNKSCSLRGKVHQLCILQLKGYGEEQVNIGQLRPQGSYIHQLYNGQYKLYWPSFTFDVDIASSCEDACMYTCVEVPCYAELPLEPGAHRESSFLNRTWCWTSLVTLETWLRMANESGFTNVLGKISQI